MKQKTIIALEQALTLPYATQRFVQLGWRVIRIETPGSPQQRSGDPNRYIGEDTGEDDLHAYFLAPNMGKEAITLNLKNPEGQKILHRLIKSLDAAVFMCNTLPFRYEQLGIDYPTLSKVQPNLIWCGISAMGPEHPDRAGYDPALQGMLGYMHLTGEPDRAPMLCGLPIIDLKAGDEAFAQILLGLLENKGKRIDISMAQCATSWLITALPQTKFAKSKDSLFTRSGNEHRSFVPSNCYPTSDGYAYLAIGSDGQWKKLCSISGFEHLQKKEWESNNNRKIYKEEIYAGIREGLKHYSTEKFIEICLQNGLAVAPVNTVKQVGDIEEIKKIMVKTTLPTGEIIPLFPAPMETEFLQENNYTLNCPPKLGEHTKAILSEAGFSDAEIKKYKQQNII